MPIQVKIFLTQIQGLNSALLAPTQSRFHTSYFTTPNSLHFATPYMIDRVECINMHISKLGSELDYFIRPHYIQLKRLLWNMHISRVGSDLLKRLSAYLDEVSMDSVCKYPSNLLSLPATKKCQFLPKLFELQGNTFKRGQLQESCPWKPQLRIIERSGMVQTSY